MPLEPARRQGRKYLNPVPTAIGGPSLMFKVGPEILLGAKARSPQGPLGPFRTDATIYRTEPGSGLRITWIGHATSIVEMDGIRILIDPVWDERASPTTWSGPKRFFPAPLQLSELPNIDAVIVSHDHYDHLGAKTIRALAGHPALAKARWITPLGVGTLLQALRVPAAQCSELNWMDSTQVGSGADNSAAGAALLGPWTFQSFRDALGIVCLAWSSASYLLRSRFRRMEWLPRHRAGVRSVRPDNAGDRRCRPVVG